MGGTYRCCDRADASVPWCMRRGGETMVAYGGDERNNSGTASCQAAVQDVRAWRGCDTVAAGLLPLNLCLE